MLYGNVLRRFFAVDLKYMETDVKNDFELYNKFLTYITNITYIIFPISSYASPNQL